MKVALKILGILIVLCLTNCTKNNGDIGNTYGLWRLVSLCEGDSVLLEDENMYMGFQSNVVTLRIVDTETNICSESYGNFTIDESDSIIIKISYGSINDYKEFEFDTNPFKAHIFVDKKELVLKSGNKTWQFEKH